MKKITIILLSIFSLFACSEEEGVTASFSISGVVSFSDVENWIDAQDVKVGLFVDGSDVPLYSVPIDSPSEGEELVYMLDNVVQGDYICQVYVEEKTLYKAELASEILSLTTDEVCDFTDVKLLSFSRIQQQVLDKCIQCHGGSSGDPAAGLILLSDLSYKHLVNVVSLHSPLYRVNAGNSDSSFIIDVLQQNNLSFDHSSSSSATEADVLLIEKWIDSGAEN